MTFWNSYKPTGNQGSNATEYNYASRIYIGSKISERFIELPAFINDLKYTVNKQMETIDDKDKTGARYIEKVSSVSMTLTIDVPANSVQEAKHNLARVSEIMRMIAPSAGYSIDKGTLAHKNSTAAPKIFILMSNLISLGRPDTVDKVKSFYELEEDGLPGFIKDFDYTPDIDAGFFIDGDYRAPRNIKVSINYAIDAIPGTVFKKDKGKITENLHAKDTAYVIRGLLINGQYMPGDTGGWPFGIVVKDSRFSDYEYDFKTLNSYDSDYANDSYSYFMIGASISKQKGKMDPSWNSKGLIRMNTSNHNIWKSPAYCLFKMFLEDYKFSKKTSLEPKEVNNTDVGRIFQNYSDSNSEFDVKFSIIADSLEQAKKNCGKVQILFRLLLTENERKPNGNFANNPTGMRKVYSPNLLEKHTSSGEISNDPKTLVENGIGSKISKISVDFINDLGYFVEDNGGVKKYYPKGFKISLAGAIVGYKNQYAGRPGNYKKNGTLIRNDKDAIIQFPFKFK